MPKIDNDFIKKMAKAYKKLHSNKSPSLPAEERKLIHSLSFWFNRYNEKILDLTLSLSLKSELERILLSLEPLMKTYDESFVNRKSFSLCHNDALTSNIFITENGIKFIDWEFSGYWLEERDLINFIKINKLNKKQRELFMQEYGYTITNKFYVLFILFYLVM